MSPAPRAVLSLLGWRDLTHELQKLLVLLFFCDKNQPGGKLAYKSIGIEDVQVGCG